MTTNKEDREAFAPEQPAGWKLVPIEPTSRMLLGGHRGGGKNCSCGVVYRAMLDAAPEPPQHIAEVMVRAASSAAEAEAQAERLEKALRLYMSAGFGNSTDFYKQAEAKRAAQAALHPTAEQEGRESFWPKLPVSGGPDWTGHD